MAVKASGKENTKYRETPPHINFYICGEVNEEKLTFLENSIKNTRANERKRSSFFCYTNNGNEKSSEFLSFFDSESGLPRSEEKKHSYHIFIDPGELSATINFEAFHSLDPEEFTNTQEHARLFFTGKNLNPPLIFMLGDDLYSYIRELGINCDKNFLKELKWYLNRLHCSARDVIINTKSHFITSGFHLTNLFSLPNIGRSLHWNFSRAMYEQKNNKGFRSQKEKPLWRMVFFITAALIFFILPAISYNAGISGDEEKHHLHAVKVYNYFETDGKDTLAINDPKYMLNYYGQSFDLFSYIFIKTFNIEKVYETRHILNGITGALAIITAGILIRYLAGSFAGFLTLLFMFLFPRFMGHAMNNPMDIPFALGYIFSIYQMIRFLRELPLFSLKHALLLILGIAFTISVRIGGLILIPYLFLFSFLYLFIHKWPWKTFSREFAMFTGKGLIYIVTISLVAYFLSILPWPYALQDPLRNPFNALGMMSNITVSLRVMFEGEIIWSDNLPWYYVPKNMLLTIPFIIWIFFFLSPYLFFRNKKDTGNFWLFTLFFVTIFPVLYIIYRESNVYGGWRHTLFIYPTFAGIAALSVNGIKNLYNSTIYRIAVIALVILGLFHPLKHIFKNYPLQYIYFNEIAGGVDNAYTHYETDYYMNSLKPATEWLLENIVAENKSDEKLRVISNAPHDIMKYYYKDHLHKVNFPYTRFYDRGAKDWDYAVFFCNYINPYQLRRGIWPPKNTIHEVKVDDATVCAVVKRENKNDYLGMQELNKGLSEGDIDRISLGIRLLEDAVDYDPHNEIAMLSLARGYIMVQQYEQARKTLGSLLQIYPDYDKALNYIAFSYISEGDYMQKPELIDKAINILAEVLSINHKFVDSYYNLGLAFFLKGDDNMAMNYLDRALNYNARHKKSYYLMATIMEKNGDQERAQQVINYANSL